MRKKRQKSDKEQRNLHLDSILLKNLHVGVHFVFEFIFVLFNDSRLLKKMNNWQEEILFKNKPSCFLNRDTGLQQPLRLQCKSEEGVRLMIKDDKNVRRFDLCCNGEQCDCKQCLHLSLLREQDLKHPLGR